MPTPRGRTSRIGVRIGARVWRDEVERFGERTAARAAAQRERARLERDGADLSALQRCDPDASDGTRLAGLVKVYVPITDGPPSERPFGFVFTPARDESGVYLALVAYGERHPRPGTRSVYERAHRRVHGRYPDEETGKASPD